MATDEQRREVAAKMRELYRLHPNEYLDVMIARAMRAVLGHDPALPYALAFADLIDRPAYEAIEHGRPDESHVCKSCSKCSYGWFENIHDKPYSYCPNCGAEVIDEDGSN